MRQGDKFEMPGEMAKVSTPRGSNRCHEGYEPP
jgi:hypothetical protein